MRPRLDEGAVLEEMGLGEPGGLEAALDLLGKVAPLLMDLQKLLACLDRKSVV